MLSWARSGHSNAGKRATWWLRKLWEDYSIEGGDDLLPTTTTYNIVIEAVSSSSILDDGGALEAEKLLLEMGEKYKNQSIEQLCPNSESFAHVIRAWVNDSEQHFSPQKQQQRYERRYHEDDNIDVEEGIKSLYRAVDWLISLQEVENENNLSSSPELFLRIIRATIIPSKYRPMSMLQLATKVFFNLSTSRHIVDEVPYTILLQVGLTALARPEYNVERDTFLEDHIRDCCENGMISTTFIRTLVNSTVYEEGWTVEERNRYVTKYFDEWPLHPSWARNLRNPNSYPCQDDIVPDDTHQNRNKQRRHDQQQQRRRYQRKPK